MLCVCMYAMMLTSLGCGARSGRPRRGCARPHVLPSTFFMCGLFNAAVSNLLRMLALMYQYIQCLAGIPPSSWTRTQT